MKPLKVMHVITTCSVGGAEMHLLQLLRDLPKDEFEITLCFFKEEAHEARSLVDDFRSAGVTTIDLGLKGRVGLRSLWRLWRVVRRVCPQVIHTHLYRADLAGGWVGRLCGCVVVASVHNLDLETKYRRIRRVVLDVYRRATRVVAISEAVGSQLIADGIPADRVVTIHYGLDLGAWPDLRIHRSASDAISLGCVGRLSHQKGYDVLLQALAIAKQDLPPFHLAIVGHDDEGIKAELGHMVRELGLSGAVEFKGFGSDIPKEMAGFDVFLLPSRWEGFGLVLLEAMASKLPVIASDTGPIGEIVIDGETGFLVPPGEATSLADAIVRLASDPEHGQAMGQAGYLRLLSHFTNTATAQRHVDLYQTLAGSS